MPRSDYFRSNANDPYSPADHTELTKVHKQYNEQTLALKTKVGRLTTTGICSKIRTL